MKKFIYIFIFFIGALFCTEKISIQPEYTGNTNWVPAIVLYQNGYNRYSINWWSGPDIPLSVQRNISEYLFELRPAGASQYSVIDTQSLDNIRFIPYSYTSKPILEEDVSYETRLTVRYRDGTERHSNQLSFVSQEVKGKILRRILIPDDPSYYPGSYFYSPSCIGFNNGFIYGVQGDYLTRIDTTTEAVTVLETNLYSFFGFHGFITNFQINNNYVYIDKVNTNFNGLLRFNVETLQIEDTVFVEPPDSAYGPRIIGNYGSDLYLMWIFIDKTYQVIKVNPNSGEILEVYPRFNLSFFYDEDFVFDGSKIWITDFLSEEFLNRIAYFDPLTGSSNQNENQVPIFEPSGLTWDGAHFWVFDRETRSYVKIGLEGI
jgi:hypothetical protein